MTRLLVVADTHIGKSRDMYAERLADQESSWQQALNLAVAHNCDAVLFAGDACELRNPSSAERAAFQRPLVGYPVPVVAINGNHDVARGDVPSAIELVGSELGGGLLIARANPGVVPVGGAAVCCLPWVSPARLRASGNGSDAAVPELLMQIAEDLRESARRFRPDLPCILLGHWATTGWRLPTGLPTDALHEPLFPVEELDRMGFDACFFGHVHSPGRITREAYSVGSPLCLDHGEENDPHGCWIWEDGEAEFVELDYRPFLTIEEDFTQNERTVAPDVTGAVVRFRYRATEEQARRIDHAEIRRELLAAGAASVQIVPTIERASRARVENMGALHPFDAIDAWIEASKKEVPGLRERGRQILKEAAA